MRTSILAFASIATLGSAVAVENSIPAAKRAIIKRQSVTTGAPDAVVLNFALTLEHLESESQRLPRRIRVVATLLLTLPHIVR
jgi:hypothetical protein